MKLTYTKSQYDVPVGKYTARFTGVTLKDPSGKMDEKGKPMPPGMTWDFVIEEGEHAGKQIDRLTGRMPTPKSACGKLLAAIADDVLKDGTEIDLQQFVGKLYRITVDEGNGDRTRLSDSPPPVRIYDGQANGHAPAVKSPPPPKGPPAKPKGEPGDGSRWMMHDAAQGEYVPMTGKQVKDHIQETKVMPADLWVYPDDGQEHNPVTAAEAGFKEAIPF